MLFWIFLLLAGGRLVPKSLLPVKMAALGLHLCWCFAIVNASVYWVQALGTLSAANGGTLGLGAVAEKHHDALSLAFQQMLHTAPIFMLLGHLLFGGGIPHLFGARMSITGAAFMTVAVHGLYFAVIFVQHLRG